MVWLNEKNIGVIKYKMSFSNECINVFISFFKTWRGINNKDKQDKEFKKIKCFFYIFRIISCNLVELQRSLIRYFNNQLIKRYFRD